MRRRWSSRAPRCFAAALHAIARSSGCKAQRSQPHVRFVPIVLKKSALQRFRPSRDIGSAERGSPSSGRRLRDRDQLGELAEVLGGGSEEELVLGTIRAPQAQAVQLQDALEVGEQHLDLLPLAA